MFLIFCAFTIGLVALTAHFISQTRIEKLSLQSSRDNVPVNTLDDAVLTWLHSGRDAGIQVRLHDPSSNARSSPISASAAHQKAVIPQGFLQSLWPTQKLNEHMSVIVEVFGDDLSKTFGPFTVHVPLKVLYFVEGRELSVYTVIGNQRVPHNFEVKCVAWPIRGSQPMEPESVTVMSTNGGGKASFHPEFSPDPRSVNCAYLGDYPRQLIKYENLHKS